MAKRRLGKVIIKINNQRIESMAGATLDIGGSTRTTQTGSNEVLGWSEAPKQSRLECSIAVGEGTSLREFDKSEVSYAFECDTGQVYACAQAWLTDSPTLSGGNDSSAKFVFEGVPCEEIL